ncbi:GNAT family N-acetyltransferase [Parvibaculum sp.]|uniref:GNAT family N-acetyltransferase n=1 Tax=Parvibaculum sp. TaxID=2024848 RepID=UPI001AFF5490|nr:GNAT family N-acetyltransferase [Parvibaculum sp.]MBO6668052.1 GNAT family N-acetyltransferase [Parvibaculum sp.]MBO6692050.1 GNAT family N-acetyltransferase [Parvibaculum sp.]MBO6715632.1 GNAT family N-acetyltransferase [Parvibaculum sp.]
MTEQAARKFTYRELCTKECDIPIFAQAWWLDASAGPRNWDVVIVESENQIQAALPFYIRRRFGVTSLSTPPLTPALGPWLKAHSARSHKVIAREKKLLTELYSQLPHCDLYLQNWHVSQLNWLPLYWMGYKQTTAYTYRLENISDPGQVWAEMEQNTRNDIRRGQERYHLTVRQAMSVAEFVSVCNKSFLRQGLTPPYDVSFVERIVLAAREHAAIELMVAGTSDGTPHAAAMILFGGDTAYYLMGGGDPNHRKSGAASLLLWEAILSCSGRSSIFDFEGSMIEPIERFFRGFGGQMTPYHTIYKANTLKGHGMLLAQAWKRSRSQKG